MLLIVSPCVMEAVAPEPLAVALPVLTIAAPAEPETKRRAAEIARAIKARPCARRLWVVDKDNIVF